MTTHSLKCWPDYFEPILSGKKKFDVRYDDRRYNVGDTLRLCEYDDRKNTFTGREVRKVVTYILRGIGAGAIAPLVGIQRGYVVLSIEDALKDLGFDDKHDKEQVTSIPFSGGRASE